MKKSILIFLVIVVVYFLYNFIFSYRIVALCNDGNLKYKEGLRLTTFSRPPFSIVNPLKKGTILAKIQEFCISNKFEEFHTFHNYDSITHRNYFLYKELAIKNSLKVKAIKSEKNELLILVSNELDNEMELVFQLNIKNDKIIGFF